MHRNPLKLNGNYESLLKINEKVLVLEYVKHKLGIKFNQCFSMVS